jgi:phenylacetate-CoA ligase
VSSAGFPDRQTIVQRQGEQLQSLLRAILPANPFYSAKYRDRTARIPPKISSWQDFLGDCPFTTKAELSADQAATPPYGTNLTFPLDRYTRCHQTSGTGGAPLRWLDTPESWEWMLGNWQIILRAADVARGDRLFFAFSFGPFIGFWLAFEAAGRLGCRCLPGGGMSSLARLRAILDHGATALCCTPTYGLHLAEIAVGEGIDLSTSAVKKLIVAGEPGGSILSTRARLEAAWPGAQVRDHHGMTETGPVSFACPARPRVLHVIETSYIAEILDPTGSKPVATGETGELVLTTLGRIGSPLLRYRTGDLVRPAAEAVCACGRSELALEGGILGRTDDMVIVRGMNVYPSTIEDLLRAQDGVAEYQVQVNRNHPLTQISIRLEPRPEVTDPGALAARVQAALQDALHLRVPVQPVPPGQLPRFEMKARRWVTTE